MLGGEGQSEASRAVYNVAKLVSNHALHIARSEAEKAALEKIDDRYQSTRKTYTARQPGPEVYKTFTMLNSTEHKISTAHKNSNTEI